MPRPALLLMLWSCSTTPPPRVPPAIDRKGGRHHAIDLLVQPDILKPQIVVLAVFVRREIPDIGLPAIAGHAGQDDRTRRVIHQQAFDIPDDFRAFLLVALA